MAEAHPRSSKRCRWFVGTEFLASSVICSGAVGRGKVRRVITARTEQGEGGLGGVWFAPQNRAEEERGLGLGSGLMASQGKGRGARVWLL